MYLFIIFVIINVEIINNILVFFCEWFLLVFLCLFICFFFESFLFVLGFVILLVNCSEVGYKLGLVNKLILVMNFRNERKDIIYFDLVINLFLEIIFWNMGIGDFFY